MSGWNPVFKTLTTSSVLMEGPDTVAVWALFMADADQNGVSTLTVPFLAQVLFKGDLDRAQEAMDNLLKPDKHSKNSTYQGRRIITTEEAGISGAGPWFLTTHEAHRKKMEVRREQDRIRKQRERARAKEKAPEREVLGNSREHEAPISAEEAKAAFTDNPGRTHYVGDSCPGGHEEEDEVEEIFDKPSPPLIENEAHDWLED